MTKQMRIALLGLTAITMASQAEASTTFATVNKTAGVNLTLQGIDGNLYGTMDGGIYGGGAIVRMTPKGLLTTLYNFCAESNCADGSRPGPLIQGLNSSLYGITATGGAYGKGTVFEFTPAGKLKTLHSFCDPTTCDDGFGASVLVLATNKNMYGLTTVGRPLASGPMKVGPCSRLPRAPSSRCWPQFVCRTPIIRHCWPRGSMEHSSHRPGAF
jgi:uncharacterized repeat protein (TIGR03803 family)